MTVKLKTISTKYGQNLTLNMKKFDQCDLYKTIKLMNYIVLQKHFKDYFFSLILKKYAIKGENIKNIV